MSVGTRGKEPSQSSWGTVEGSMAEKVSTAGWPRGVETETPLGTSMGWVWQRLLHHHASPSHSTQWCGRTGVMLPAGLLSSWGLADLPQLQQLLISEEKGLLHPFRASTTYFDPCTIWSTGCMMQMPELLPKAVSAVPVPAPKKTFIGKTKLGMHNTFKFSRTFYSPPLGFLMRMIRKVTSKTAAAHTTTIRMMRNRDRWGPWTSRAIQQKTFKQRSPPGSW